MLFFKTTVYNIAVDIYSNVTFENEDRKGRYFFMWKEGKVLFRCHVVFTSPLKFPT
jgi:hypothetical protein